MDGGTYYLAKAKKMFLQIPDFAIRNEGVSLNATDFAVLCLLKHQYFQTNKGTLTVNHMRLKRVLAINDGRVLKKSLSSLRVAGIITNEIVELPRKGGALTVVLDEEAISRKTFTQIPSSILDRVESIGHLGLRLLFYYESHINRGQLKKQFCYSSYRTIAEKLSISEVTLSKYNSTLVAEGLLEIVKSSIHTDDSYTEDDKLAFVKYNNHYTPVVGSM